MKKIIELFNLPHFYILYLCVFIVRGHNHKSKVSGFGNRMLRKTLGLVIFLFVFVLFFNPLVSMFLFIIGQNYVVNFNKI